jgi:hypothetical protein
MLASAPTDQTPRPRRRAPIATLIALCALTAGAQTLAPSTATAMDDNGGAGECRSFAGAPPGAGWNGTEFCTLTDGSAGGGGGAGGSSGDDSGGGSDSDGDTLGHEVIVIVDPVNPLCPSRHLCLPGQSSGGRPLGIDGDRPRGGGPRPGGRATGGEVKKPKPKAPAPASKRACQALANTLKHLDYKAVLAYRDSRRARKTDLEGNPFSYDPALEAKIPRVDGAIAAWRTGLCRGQLPGALPLGI